MQKLIILLFLTLSLFALNDVKKNSKMKIKTSNNFSKVKLLVKSPMYSKEMARKRKRKEHWITNIKVKAKNKLILNLETTPHLSTNPIIKFNYKNIRSRKLILEYTDNYKYTQKDTHEVKFYNREEHASTISEPLVLTTPELAENGGAVPVSIRSNIPTKSVSVYAKTDTGGYFFIAKFISTPYTIINYHLKIKLLNTGYIKVVLKAKNGNIYTKENQVYVAIGGGDQ